MSRRRFIQVLVPVLLFTLTLGLPGRAAVSSEQTQAKADLIVMSFNIRYGTADDGENNWDKRRDLACDLVRRQGPDVIGLQEALLADRRYPAGPAGVRRDRRRPGRRQDQGRILRDSLP